MIDVERARADTPAVENLDCFFSCGAGLMPQQVLDLLSATRVAADRYELDPAARLAAAVAAVWPSGLRDETGRRARAARAHGQSPTGRHSTPPEGVRG